MAGTTHGENPRPDRRTLPAVRVACPWCEAEFGVSGYLDRCRFYWRDVEVVRWECPRCVKWEDVGIQPDEVQRGYVYWAGVPHFAQMESVGVPGLRSRRIEGGLQVEYGDRVWLIGDRDLS